jgi:hypothetical protein
LLPAVYSLAEPCEGFWDGKDVFQEQPSQGFNRLLLPVYRPRIHEEGKYDKMI